MSIKPRSVPAKKLTQSIISTDLSIKLNNIFDWDGVTNLVAGDFGTQLFAVLMNETKSTIEIIELNPATIASASITVLKRGLSFDGQETEVTANKLDWPANETTVQLGSDVPQLLNNFVDKSRTQTIDGVKTFLQFPLKSGSLTPAAPGDFATKAYVDFVALGTTVVDAIVASGIAGESLVAGNIVYFKEADQKWWKTDADVAATVNEAKIGFAQSAAVANDPLNILVQGTEKNQVGLTAGSKYYVSNTAGAISTTPGTNPRFVGWAKTTTQLLFAYEIDIPQLTQAEKDALAGTAGTPGNLNRFLTDDDTYGTGSIPRGGPFMAEYPFGSGADGDYVLDGAQAAVGGLFSKAGSIYTLLRDANFDDITINNGVTLRPASYRLYVNGTLTNNGLIEGDGANGNAGSGSPYPNGNSAPGGAGGVNSAGTIHSGAPGTTGGSGQSNATGATPAGGPGANALGTTVIVDIAGAVGGTGGGSGGGGGSTSNVLEAVVLAILEYSIAWTQAVEFNAGTRWLTAIKGVVTGSTLSSTGRSTGGGGGSSNGNFTVNGYGPTAAGGGGSGASGRLIFISARNFVQGGTGVIRANGGTGGNGGNGLNPVVPYGFFLGNGGGGAGGNGGVLVLLYSSYVNTGTFTFNGGSGGAPGSGPSAGGSAGGNGNAGTYFRVKL